MGKVFILSRSRPPWELFISVRFTGKVNAPKIRGVNAPKFGLVNALKMDVVAAPKLGTGRAENWARVARLKSQRR